MFDALNCTYDAWVDDTLPHKHYCPVSEHEHEPIELTPAGGMHTKLSTRCDLFPPAALLKVAEVLAEGVQKYSVNNWRLIDRDGHLNHALTHLLEYLNGGEEYNIAHAACRLLFALETNDGPESSRKRGNLGTVKSHTSEASDA